MKALTIAWVAILRLIRERSNIFFVFILPIGIIVIIGAQFGGSFTPTLGLVVESGAGELGESLATSFEARDDIEVVRYETSDEAVASVERGTVQAAVVIPVDYDERLGGGGTTEVGFLARPDAAVFQTIVASEVTDQASIIRAARFASSETDAPFDDALALAGTLEATVTGVVVSVESVGEAIFPSSMGQFDLGASSQLVLFMFLTGLTGSAAIIETRRLGVASRMLSTPTPAGTVVTGEGLGRFGVVMVQGLYILFATLFLFRVNWGDPLGAAAVMILFGAVATGAAMLMGTVFSNDQQAGGVAVLFGIGLAALGGCMVPIELFSDTMQRVAHITPHAWALDAFAVLVRQDGTIVDILPELGVLAAYAAALLTIAAFRLRRSMSAH